MVEDGYDAPAALRRAAQELGLRQPLAGLKHTDLYAAINEYRALFRPAQAQQLLRERQLALNAMDMVQDFNPRLFGSLAHGGGALGPIQLLLTAPTPEAVMLHLSNRHIPWTDREMTLRYSRNRRAARPAFTFEAGGATVILITLPDQGQSDPPVDPIDGSRLITLSRDDLARLLAGSE